jgi:hypothetical protein
MRASLTFCSARGECPAATCPHKFGSALGGSGNLLIRSGFGTTLEALMRKAMLAFFLAGAAPVAMATGASAAPAGAALTAAGAVDTASVVTRVDYNRRYYRGYRPAYRRPAGYGYYAPRPYYPGPAYPVPPVVYYQPPPVVYYPPPVAYAPVAPYRYGYGGPSAYYDNYSGW